MMLSSESGAVADVRVSFSVPFHNLLWFRGGSGHYKRIWVWLTHRQGLPKEAESR